MIYKSFIKKKGQHYGEEAFQSAVYLLAAVDSIRITNNVPNPKPHVLEIAVPSEWHQIINGKVEPVYSVKAIIRVIGLVITLTGQVRKYTLFNASNMKFERSQLNVLIDIPKVKQPITTIYTEPQLKEFLDRPEAVKVTIGRIRLPRILNGSLYWPPSERALRKIMKLMQAFQAGEIPDPRPFKFTDIEGTDIETIWEPVWNAKGDDKEVK